MPLNEIRAPLSSTAPKFVCALCSTLFALHHRVVIDVVAPGASAMSTVERFTSTPSKKSIRSVMASALLPLLVRICSYRHRLARLQLSTASLLHGTGFGVTVMDRVPAPSGGGEAASTVAEGAVGDESVLPHANVMRAAAQTGAAQQVRTNLSQFIPMTPTNGNTRSGSDGAEQASKRQTRQRLGYGTPAYCRAMPAGRIAPARPQHPKGFARKLPEPEGQPPPSRFGE